MSGQDPRRAAAALLQAILEDRASLAALDTTGSSEPALLQELAYGVCRHYHALDALLAELMPRALKRKDRDVHCLLLVGLYQLFHLRIPDHAVLHQTVNCVPKAKPWARGLVNAVLREAQRRYPAYDPDAFRDPLRRHSHPRWLISALRQDWPQHWEAILEGNNRRAPLSLRVNLARGGRAEALDALRAAGIEALPGPFADTALRLLQPRPVQELPGFAEGRLSVQDEASQLAAALLALAPGQRVLDACAAPGGKTCAMLERQEGLVLTALDNDAKRLDRVQDNLQRLDLQARLLCAEAQQPETWWDGQPFDRILLDLPCSGTGVIRRHPDIKLLRTPEQLEALRPRQDALLRAVWRCLAPGGLLLYSTCSVLKRENEERVAAFLAEEPGALHVPIEANWGEARPCGRQLLPTGEAGHDGFYYALLRKR